MKDFLKGFGIVVLAGGVLMVFLFLYSFFPAPMSGVSWWHRGGAQRVAAKKTTAELIAEASAKSSDIRGLYMTADVANDSGAGATRLRERIIGMADKTEINGIVIDVKETCGPDYTEARLKKLLEELHGKNIWAIARIAAFKDASQREAHPEWYLTRRIAKAASDGCPNKHNLIVRNPGHPASGAPFWQDVKGGYWMDPASPGARAYIAGSGRRMIDLGFDELQFDYVRFPSDGDVSAAEYPAWDKKIPKYEVMKDFFAFLNKNLKEYKPDIILSADLFGYVAAQGRDESIGQRLEDIGDNFDYVSFMVYPSHYYNGLELPADASHDLSAVNFTSSQARTHPDVVVGRSLLAARDFLEGNAATSTATTTPVMPRSRARLRPWLEDFFHEQDRVAGRPYGVEKVRLQIDAAEETGEHGWLLWNSSNVYSEGALHEN